MGGLKKAIFPDPYSGLVRAVTRGFLILEQLPSGLPTNISH